MVVERVVFACLAIGLATLATTYATTHAQTLGLRVAVVPPGWAGAIVLGFVFVAFVITFALVTAGSLPRARRVRLGSALGLATIAVVLAPMTFFHRLPDAWQAPELYETVRMVPLIALGLALGLAAPAGMRRTAAWGATLLALCAVLDRVGRALMLDGAIATPLGALAWRIGPALALALGIALLAVTYALGAARGGAARA